MIYMISRVIFNTWKLEITNSKKKEILVVLLVIDTHDSKNHIWYMKICNINCVWLKNVWFFNSNLIIYYLRFHPFLVKFFNINIFKLSSISNYRLGDKVYMVPHLSQGWFRYMHQKYFGTICRWSFFKFLRLCL